MMTTTGRNEQELTDCVMGRNANQAIEVEWRFGIVESTLK